MAVIYNVFILGFWGLFLSLQARPRVGKVAGTTGLGLWRVHDGLMDSSYVCASPSRLVSSRLSCYRCIGQLGNISCHVSYRWVVAGDGNRWPKGGTDTGPGPPTPAFPRTCRATLSRDLPVERRDGWVAGGQMLLALPI